MKLLFYSDLSKYRSQLMGIAALMIIVCHAPAHIDDLPLALNVMFQHLGIGVDIFLFLSGFGLYHSLNKRNSRLIFWYRTRYLKLFIPYLLFVVPMFYYLKIKCDYTWGIYIMNVFTFSYWSKGWGLWFVAMLVPVYLISPFVKKIIDSEFLYLKFFILVVLASLFIGLLSKESGYPLYSIRMCILRFPAFYIGMLWASKRNENTVEKFVIIVSGISILLFVSMKFIFSMNMSILSCYWIVMLIMLYLMILFVKNINSEIINRFNLFMGDVSLESYCTNVFLVGSIMDMFSEVFMTLSYIISTIICLIVSFIIHKLSKFILTNYCI